jgi:hypothetical protein
VRLRGSTLQPRAPRLQPCVRAATLGTRLQPSSVPDGLFVPRALLPCALCATLSLLLTSEIASEKNGDLHPARPAALHTPAHLSTPRAPVSGFMTGLSNTKVLGRAMVNTLGLIILVGFLGYGLVEVPRSLWNKGDVAGQLRFLQFKVAVQSEELQSARRKLEETLELVHSTDAQLREEARAASTQSFTRMEKHMTTMLTLCSKARAVPPCACLARAVRMRSACTCYMHMHMLCACRVCMQCTRPSFTLQTTLSWVRQPSDPNLVPQHCQMWPDPPSHAAAHRSRGPAHARMRRAALWARGEMWGDVGSWALAAWRPVRGCCCGGALVPARSRHLRLALVL